ncbi:uncharacterized protein STEHIDRAFT_112413 [Stereum hirsutum FP-91666 SS1]|uniref:uncharacterized protein n=1 Tax=Stereum hirsutum (strain FP-91666) TaxID=721885 RepID=UPI000444A5E3|nr:uncharacterized protein STEHIDRAFT_112413 [Stereum hirsutum FP-91666 SS1]EIM84880.1 hypothetical protein STEHIDRAFT_112413 [Stereum hirsutum FP-91666 SS1]
MSFAHCRRHCPDFRSLPHENDLDEEYYAMDESSGTFRPSFHWAFLGEITHDTSLFIGDRPRYLVKDKVGNRHPIHFHLDSLDDMFFDMNERKDYKVGRTICVYYANQHNFVDGTIGLRIESTESVKIIRCSLEALIEVNVSELDQAVNCEACGKEGGGTLSKCSRCGVKYCDKGCQAKDWRSGHKTRCTAVCQVREWERKDWATFRSFW